MKNTITMETRKANEILYRAWLANENSNKWFKYAQENTGTEYGETCERIWQDQHSQSHAYLEAWSIITGIEIGSYELSKFSYSDFEGMTLDF